MVPMCDDVTNAKLLLLLLLVLQSSDFVAQINTKDYQTLIKAAAAAVGAEAGAKQAQKLRERKIEKMASATQTRILFVYRLSNVVCVVFIRNAHGILYMDGRVRLCV